MLRPARWSLSVLVPVLVLLGCSVPTEVSEDTGSLIETHRAILDGTVRGDFDQPLRDVDIVVRFANSRFPAPTTQTDAAGNFLLVLAIYNGSGGADSAAATVYAFARQGFHSSAGADHADVMVRFLPRAQEPPRTSVTLRLPVF